VWSVPSSSESQKLGAYGDSGVTSESMVWVESMEDNGSRSGQFWRDLSSIRMVRQSRGPWARDECSSIVKLCGGQFIVIQPDGSRQFRLVQAEHGTLCSLALYWRLG